MKLNLYIEEINLLNASTCSQSHQHRQSEEYQTRDVHIHRWYQENPQLVSHRHTKDRCFAWRSTGLSSSLLLELEECVNWPWHRTVEQDTCDNATRTCGQFRRRSYAQRTPSRETERSSVSLLSPLSSPPSDLKEYCLLLDLSIISSNPILGNKKQGLGKPCFLSSLGGIASEPLSGRRPSLIRRFHWEKYMDFLYLVEKTESGLHILREKCL